MKYLLLSVLVVSLVGIMSVPDAFAKMYTDPDNRFSIEYPYGWIKELGNEDWLIIDFLDKYNWDAFFRVEFYEDISYAGTGDSNILEEILEIEREYCNTSTYQVDGLICYNYKVMILLLFIQTKIERRTLLINNTRNSMTIPISLENI